MTLVGNNGFCAFVTGTPVNLTRRYGAPATTDDATFGTANAAALRKSRRSSGAYGTSRAAPGKSTACRDERPFPSHEGDALGSVRVGGAREPDGSSDEPEAEALGTRLGLKRARETLLFRFTHCFLQESPIVSAGKVFSSPVFLDCLLDCLNPGKYNSQT